jgi:glycosyltransferase involved in cell wall biosynthesis
MLVKNIGNQKITVVVNGRFHAFDYAAELYKNKLLLRMISSMPYSVAKKYGIGREVYIGLPVFEILKRVWRIIFKKEISPALYSKLFTYTALFFIPDNTNIIISNAGCSKEIFESKKLKNAYKVLDRGSSHTLTNINANKLAAEYHNVKWKQNPANYVKRELIEYNLANKILIPSSYVKGTFTENGIEDKKLLLIPYAFSFRKFEGLKVVPKYKELAVLFVGQMNHLKGIGVLIKAMKLVRVEIPKATLWLVGAKNPLINDSLLNEEWIKYYGILRGKDLLDKYLRASVFCLLSFDEGFGLVLTEALHCGLPIVATPNTAAADIITNGINGFIVPVGDHIKTAEKIINILEKSHPQQKGNIEAENKIDHMSWERFCDLLIENILSNNL